MALSPEQIFALAINAGLSAADARTATAVALGESSGNPAANLVTSQEDSRGLWQINTYAHPRYDPNSLYDPVANAKAMAEVSGGGSNWRPWTVYTSGKYQRYMPQVETVVNAYEAGLVDIAALVSSVGGTPNPSVQQQQATQAPRATQSSSQGLFGAGATGLRQGTQITRPPDGGFLVNVDGQTKIVFNLGPEVDVFFDIDPNLNWDLNGYAWAVAPNLVNADIVKAGWVRGGSASELADVSGDLKSWVDKQINILLGGNTEASKDQEVRRIFLDWAVNPELSDAEIQARLHQTNYWKTHTQGQLDWNDLSPADQQKKIDDAAADLAALYTDQVGEGISTSDPTLRQWAMDIASGKRTQQSVLMNDIRKIAEGKPGSPWAAQLHERENNVDQTRGQLQKLYNDWGLPVSADTLQRVTENVALGQNSQQDIIDSLKEQASGLYPTKPKEIPTVTWASPYLQTYQNLMEVGDPGIFHSDIQKALTSGINLGDFQKQLMLRPEWTNTRNGKDSLAQAALKLQQATGFS